MTELNLLLIGPPGAGKGTQAERLRGDFDLPYIATGDLLREHRATGTALGQQASAYMQRGELVPDTLVVAMIRDRMERDASDGFLLDGFPRTIPQARALDAELDRRGRRLSAALVIDVPDDEVVRRLGGRRVCPHGHVYHLEFEPPQRQGVCDHDGAPLVQRDDDRPETIRRRLAVYHEQTKPLIGYYDERGLLRRFDGCRPPTEIHDHIRATLATLRLEDQL